MKSWRAMRETEEHKDSKLEKAQVQESWGNEGTNLRAPGAKYSEVSEKPWVVFESPSRTTGTLRFVFYVPSPQRSLSPGIWPSLCLQVVSALSQPRGPRALKRPGKNRFVQVTGTDLRLANMCSCQWPWMWERNLLHPTSARLCVCAHIHIKSSLPLCCLLC